MGRGKPNVTTLHNATSTSQSIRTTIPEHIALKLDLDSKLNLCKYCSSGNIRKDGYRINKRGKLQRFKCLGYQKRFVANFGFEKIRCCFDRRLSSILQLHKEASLSWRQDSSRIFKH